MLFKHNILDLENHRHMESSLNCLYKGYRYMGDLGIDFSFLLIGI